MVCGFCVAGRALMRMPRIRSSLGAECGVHPHRDVDSGRGQDIRKRTFALACAVGRAAMGIPWQSRGAPLASQLLRASAAIGANLEEAKAASSRREFVRMCDIALRETRETVYWLRLCIALDLLPPSAVDLQEEGAEIANILATIILRTKKRMALESRAPSR